MSHLPLRSFWAELEKLAEVPPDSVAATYRTELRRLRDVGQLRSAKAVQRWNGTKDLAVLQPREQGLAFMRGMSKSKKFFGKLITASVKTSNVGFPERPGFQHFTHAAELAGLATLGVPSAQKLRKIRSKETSPEEKRTAKYELAGLGILGVPSALHLAHSGYKKLRGH